MTRAFSVRLNDAAVGHLSETDDGRVAFRFADDYRRLVRRPVLSQSLEDDLEKTYRGKRRDLPAFFANLVPEGHLRELIEESLGLDRGDDLGLLAAVGYDLPGAVDISPAEVEAFAHGENGVDEAAPSRLDENEREPSLRFSLAGIQLKFSVAREFEKLTLPAHGVRGEWIVKLDSPRFPNVVENEYATLQWARTAGFSVPECHLLPISALAAELRAYAASGTHVLVVKRYDREGGRRIHQEDFAQVTGLQPARKYDHVTYDQCAALISKIVGLSAYFEFIRRLIFVVASGNSDAHLKNWSLLYPNGVEPELTPVYDQVSTIAWPDVTRELALKLGGVKAMLQIDEAAVRRLAGKAGCDANETWKVAKDTIISIADSWRPSNASDVMLKEHAAALRDYWLRAPLLRAHAPALFL